MTPAPCPICRHVGIEARSRETTGDRARGWPECSNCGLEGPWFTLPADEAQTIAFFDRATTVWNQGLERDDDDHA